jgi:hypothetical protein
VQDRGAGEFWLDHAKIVGKDLGWLDAAERLTLWNVKVPLNFLQRLERLWWLDVRGGSAADLKIAVGCRQLRYLSINQVRGLTDLALLPEFENLELLSLYGLTHLEELPSLRELGRLRRVEIGQMRALPSIGAILDAPYLEELLVSKMVTITEDDVTKINANAKLAKFAWNTVDVPRWLCDPVLARIKKTEAKWMHAIDWFNVRDVNR